MCAVILKLKLHFDSLLLLLLFAFLIRIVFVVLIFVHCDYCYCYPYCRGDNGELRLEIRRAVQLKNSGPYSVPCSQMLNLGTLAAVANAVSMKSVFHIYYNPRYEQN